MAKMVIPGQLARAMSTIGGRSLLKSAETLAASLVRLNSGSRARSDGSEVVISFGGDNVSVSALAEGAVLKGSYYAFEGGSLSFNGSTRALHRVKATLFQLAQLRKPYLLGMYGAKQLERYGLSIGYIDALEGHVEKLRVE